MGAIDRSLQGSMRDPQPRRVFARQVGARRDGEAEQAAALDEFAAMGSPLRSIRAVAASRRPF